MDILVCPVCKSGLTLTAREERADEVIIGSLACRGCAAVYPIEDGIPNLLRKEMRDQPAP